MTMISVGTFRWNSVSSWALQNQSSIGRRSTGRALGSLLGAVGLCLLSGSAFAQGAPAPSEPAPADPTTAPTADAQAAPAAPAPIDPSLDPGSPNPANVDANSLEPGPVAGAGDLDANLDPGTPAGKGGMEEVVVTVDRRAKSLQTYSGTASAFSENQLATVGITNVRELSSVVPGLQIGVAEGNAEVYIRGIGSDNDTELGDEAVALHLDGVYLPRPRGVGSMFFDIARVEVNSGPQGTLRGRNAVGGTVNIVSNKPKLGEFGANAEATFGTFAERRYQGMVNIPIGDTLAFRFAAFSEVHDPYYQNAGPIYDIPGAESADSFAYRAQLLWKPSHAFEALLAYDYTGERGTGYSGSNFQQPLTQVNTQGTVDTTDDTPNPYDITKIKNPRQVYYRGMHPSIDMKHWGTRAELTYDAGPVLFQALGSYRDLKYDQVDGSNAGLVYPGFDYTGGANPQQLSDNFSQSIWHTRSQSEIAEIRIFAPDSARFRWTIGGFYFNESQYAFLGQTSDYANGFGGGEFNMPDVKGGSVAGYADGTFDVTEKWRLIGGARVTHEHKSRNNGLWALWQGFGPGADGQPLRFGTEGFQYAMENRTVFNLAPTSSVSDRVNAFLNGIRSFGARDTVPQYLCADPTAAVPGQAQTPRVIPNGTGGLKCSSGINPALLAQDAAYNADPTQPRPFAINMIPQNDSISNNFFDWRLGTEYDLAKDHLLYATVTTAHKAGGFNDTIRDSVTQEPTNPPQYKPEAIISFEVGSKNMFLDRHLKLNASAFVYRYSDQVFQTIVTVTPDDPTQMGDQSSSVAVRQNAASSTVMGLDADVIYSLPLGLEAEVHALALDARFGDNTIVNDSRIGFDVSQYKVDIGGNWLPRASPITLNYSLSQFLPTTTAGIFHWLVSAQTVAQHYMSVFNGDGKLLPEVNGNIPTTASYTTLTQPGGPARLTDVVPTYTRFDVGAGWKHPDSRLSIEGYVNNVFNIAYATTVISTPGLNLRFFNPPRTAGVRVRVDW